MLKANTGKNLIIKVGESCFARYPIKTHLVTPADKNPADFVKKYTQRLLQKNDIIFVSEKIISIMQGRSYPLEQVRPSEIATFLSRFVYKNPGGIGLASPETMQLAIEEVGILRILLAAFMSAITKPFGLRGIFYIVAGDQARAIDGAVPYAIAPYNNYVTKGPKNPKRVACDISKTTEHPAVIIDANDFGIRILGEFPKINKKLIAKALADNPLGQSDESTPLGILRKIKG